MNKKIVKIILTPIIFLAVYFLAVAISDTIENRKVYKEPETQKDTYQYSDNVYLLHTSNGEKDIIRDLNNGGYNPIPSIQAKDGYGKDFKTYKSKLGFSFKYPDYLEVIDTFDGGTYRYLLIPKEIKEDKSLPITSIIISVADNSENLKPEEWFLKQIEGYPVEERRNYYKTTIDGNDAVYTNGGMWTVLNTPDDKYRLSIADYSEPEANELFTEMGIVMESLTFE